MVDIQLLLEYDLRYPTLHGTHTTTQRCRNFRPAIDHIVEIVLRKIRSGSQAGSILCSSRMCSLNAAHTSSIASFGLRSSGSRNGWSQIEHL
jgi:hypothetical protein